MSADATPQTILRQLRLRARLSQRELAARAGTAQSVVARIESGTTDPSWQTLQRLIHAAGGHVSLQLDMLPQLDSPPLDPQLLDDVPRILALSPENRLREVAAISRFTVGARRV
jgi:transcriptional regulator with XRE-family HTH domain